MGNSPSTGVRPGNGDNSCVVSVRGTSARLHFRGREVEQSIDGGITESWSMRYQSAGLPEVCLFILRKALGNITMISPLHDNKLLEIKIFDELYELGACKCFQIIVRRDEAGHFYYNLRANMNFYIVEDLASITSNALGDIIETHIDMYGFGPRRGLLVREWKRKSKNQNYYMGTVAHYYVNVENGEDVGLSVVVKRIRVSPNGQFDFAVDGPEQHPVNALAYMFKEVLRTRTWKPTHCPHCASNKYFRGKQFESDSDIDNFPAPPPHGLARNAGSIVSNEGKFNGNNNGNTYINYFYGGK